MLSHLSIENFATAARLEMEFAGGMTVITGETGAGKSIMLGALGLALGDRADARVVRNGEERADIHTSFDISDCKQARQWLQEHDLLSGEDCLLRRVVTRDGRSRAYINGHPVTLQSMKELGNMLLNIHNQHAHQSLLKKDQQRILLDDYAGTSGQLAEIRQLAQQHQQCRQRLNKLEANRTEQSAKAQLLGYQVSELDKLNLQEGELAELDQQQKQLANGEQLLQASSHALALCKEGELNVISILNQAMRSLGTISDKSQALGNTRELLNTALIQVEEACGDLQHYLDSFELDPERLQTIESRLGAIYDIARKHRIKPDQLAEFELQLRAEYESLTGNDSEIEQLQQQLVELEQGYQKIAADLSSQRKSAAIKLQKQIEKQLDQLSMSNCRFELALTPRENQQPHHNGNEDIEFLVSTNPGQATQPLAKIASGGELSRISLAIQVITAQTSVIPTLVFDEVDVGIGGGIAEVVGRLLHKLGQRGQVLCVTHQPQVASQGDHHLFVSKLQKKHNTTTELKQLDDNDKIEEIARMLGGIAITDQSRAHAQEMLAH